MERHKSLATKSKRMRTCKVIGPPRSTKEHPTAVPVPEAVLGPNEIARLAHSYWEGRGCKGDSSEEDWLRAERELKRRQD